MLHLAKDGIFPITKDKDGKLLKELPASGLHVAGTIQGEGKLNGVPSLFIRLASIARGKHLPGILANVTRHTRPLK